MEEERGGLCYSAENLMGHLNRTLHQGVNAGVLWLPWLHTAPLLALPNKVKVCVPASCLTCAFVSTQPVTKATDTPVAARDVLALTVDAGTELTLVHV